MENDSSTLTKIINKKEISILITPFNRDEIFAKIGYSVDNKGFLIDKKIGQRIKSGGSEINARQDPNFALIGGSHVFVKNIAGFSQYLTEKGCLKLREE